MLCHFKQILAVAIISVDFSGTVLTPNIISAQTSIPKTSVVTPQNQMLEQNPLNLTNDQKQQFKALNEKALQLIQEVLTPEQLEKFTAELEKGDRNSAWKAIKLSREQKVSITEINRSTNEEKFAILTTKQRYHLKKRNALFFSK
ncbi:hypothetical protein [Pseudanabaena yagii]|uniref:Uncharacterized protein n=1 Tax=Pseudanabaena yagii GIHE-NHR1 TaxID=2722753 RepID=A0ABX1LY43_9CYAN|nr:hypothetical protein [Pseudanabaena yagii]NMF61099.1 hypothetical protein [Pseudanabaena yagii GIHE-NHR1]